MAFEEQVILVIGFVASLSLFSGSYWSIRFVTHKERFTPKSEDKSQFIAFFGAVIITTFFVWFLISL